MISWIASLENFYDVKTPSGIRLYSVTKLGSIIKGVSNNSKYALTDITTKMIHFTVKKVATTDAGFYKTSSVIGDENESCALLIVTGNYQYI